MFTRERVVEAMGRCLDEKERQILGARFGIETGISMPLQAVCSQYGITVDELRQMEKKVLEQIKGHTPPQGR